MAKDNRKIHSGIRHEGTTYKAGMEDELSEVMSQKQLDRLADRGAVSGNWKGLVEDSEDDLGEDDDSQKTDEPVAQEEAPAAKKPAAKQSSAKKSSSKKSAAKK